MSSFQIFDHVAAYPRKGFMCVIMKRVTTILSLLTYISVVRTAPWPYQKCWWSWTIKYPLRCQIYRKIPTLSFLFICTHTRLPYQKVNAGCSGTVQLTTLQGIVDDGYSPLYPGDLNCVWVINPPGDARVTLEFQTFDTSSNKLVAAADEVKIYDGVTTSSSLLRTLTSKPSGPIISSGGALTVSFSTSGDRGAGFRATFTSVRCISYAFL